MAIETNLNQSPYYDDFNESKNFHRVLFRPGYAVQARELTQLQTILQNQVERFANQILVDGTIITGGGLITDQVQYVKLRDKDANNRVLQMSDLFTDSAYTKIANLTVTGATTGMTGKLVWATTGSEAGSPNYFTVHVHYTNSGSNNTVKTFANNEVLLFRWSGNSLFKVAANTITTGATGVGLKANINDGIVYHKGNFIRLPAQSVIVSKYNPTPNAYIGLTTTETLIDSNDDASLLDNAAGATNYTAPGANRLKLYPTLTVKSYGYANTASFFRIATVEGGSIVQRAPDSMYSNIGKYIAERIYDTNGNFVIDPFNLRIREHLKKTNSLGRYTLAESGNYLKLVVEVEKGAAYVNGDKIQLNAPRFLEVDKATDYDTSDAVVVGQQFGNYVNVKEVVGTWDFQGLRTVSLRNARQHGISGENLGAQQASGTEIGTARVRGFQWDSGTPGTYNGRFRIYLFDVNMNSGYSFADVRGLYVNNAVGPKSMADIILETNGTAKLQETNLNTLVFPTGIKSIKQYTDSSGTNDTQFVYRTEKTVNFSTSGTATVTANTAHAGGTETMNETGSPLSNNEERNILVVARETVSTAPHTGTVTQSGNTVTGVGTAFSTTYQVGDFIKVASNNPMRVTEVTNNTTLKTANTQTVGSASAHSTTFPIGYIFDLSGNGTITSTSSTHTINLQQANLASTFSASVYFNRLRSSAVQAAKTVNKNKFVHINTGSHSASKTGPWALGVSDAYKIEAVYKGSNTGVSSSSTDVTTHFELDNGQKDAYYDTAYLKQKATSTLNLTNAGLLVKFSYFGRDRSAGIGFLTADSYPIDDQNTANTTAITTQEIPLFTSPTTGITRDLRDSVDFRPIKTNTLTPSANGVATQTPSITNPTASSTYNIDSDGAHMPTPDENFQADIQYYLPRKDRVLITQGGAFRVIKGIPDLSPKTPPEFAGSMTLGTLNIPAYPSLSPYVATQYNRTDYQVTLDLENNRRYTMRDLRAIDNRVKNLEYYSTLNLLETSALNKQVFSDTTGTDRYKNGFFVDNFSSMLNSDTKNAYYRAAIDVNLGRLRPTYKRNFVALNQTPVDTAQMDSTNYQKTGDLVTLSYTNREYLTQPYASKLRNPVQELLFNWRGQVVLDPAMDNAPDITTLPEIQVDFDGMYDAMLQSLINQGIDPNGTTWGDWAVTNRGSGPTVRQGTGAGLRGGAARERTVTTTSLSTVTETISLGTQIESISLREFMRSRVIKFTGVRMRPSTKVYAFFDDEKVSSYCTPTNSSFVATGIEGANLVTDSTGTVYGNFRLPNDNNFKFRSGTKRFTLKDVANPLTEASLVTTTAHGDYTSQAFDITQRGTTLNIKTPQITQQSTVERQVLNTVPDGDRAWWDPLAQSFNVNVSGTKDGIYVTKIDLFFGKKDSTLPITLQIREMQNGFPTETIVPGGLKTLAASAVNISATGATATSFIFDHPVFLRNNTDYAMVAVPGGNSDQYALWVAKLGDDDVRLPNTVINKQTASGVLFSSSNDKTWNPIQDEDLKFTVHCAKFTTSSATIYLEGDSLDYFTIDQLDGSFRIGESVTAESVLTFANNQTINVGDILKSKHAANNNSVQHSGYANGVVREIVGYNATTDRVTVKVDPFGTFSTTATGNTNNLYVSGTWVGNTTAYSANSATGKVSFYYGLAGKMHLDNSAGGFANGYVRGQSSGASARITSVNNLVMNAVVPKIPQITHLGTSATWSVRSTSTGGTISPTYKNIELGIDNNFYDGEKKVYSYSNESGLSAVAGSTKSFVLKGTFSTTDDYVSPVIDVSRANMLILENVINNDATDEQKTYGNASMRYISKKVVLEDGQDAEDMVVYMNAYKPQGTDIKVYARLLNGEDGEAFDDKDFTLMTQVTASNTYSVGVDGTDVREYEFGFSANTNGQNFLSAANNFARLNSSNNNIVAYRGTDGSVYHTYKTFAIKIVMTATGTNLIPLVDDIRVIALQK